MKETGIVGNNALNPPRLLRFRMDLRHVSGSPPAEGTDALLFC